MKFENILNSYFGRVYSEDDYVRLTCSTIKQWGFSGETAIVSVCLCRDEISQSLRSIIEQQWGKTFNLSSLAGMFFAGQTGLAAAMHHSPNIGGKERYVFYALPHIAVNGDGRLGICTRTGREGESSACGALIAFQKELTSGKLNLSLDDVDIEQNLLKRRLLREIPYGQIPDLLALTLTTQKVIQKDIEYALNTVVDRRKSDYAIFTGIQIHGPGSNYVYPVSSYAVVNEVMEMINFEKEAA